MTPTKTRSRARLDGPQRAAMAAERQACECHRVLASHFEALHFAPIAALCRSLATRHEQAIAALRKAGVESPAAGPWLEPRARDFMLRVASARQLLDIAVTLEADLSRIHEESGDRDLGQRARDNEKVLRDTLEALPTTLDWEALIAQGMVPALPLGAERRSHRKH